VVANDASFATLKARSAVTGNSGLALTVVHAFFNRFCFPKGQTVVREEQLHGKMMSVSGRRMSAVLAGTGLACICFGPACVISGAFGRHQLVLGA
jgi:hypothetical protein